MQFTLKAEFPVSAESLYKAWLSSEGHSKMTGSKAVVGKQIGDRFTAWDGYISGTHLELKPFSRIVQSWRTTEFPKGQSDSLVELTFSEQTGKTELTLHHSSLGREDHHYKKGWEDHYFTPMKAYFEREAPI